jgi:hypothetical protein
MINFQRFGKATFIAETEPLWEGVSGKKRERIMGGIQRARKGTKRLKMRPGMNLGRFQMFQSFRKFDFI